MLSGALGAASGTAMARLGGHGGILKAQLGTLGFILELPGIIFGALGDGFGRPRLKTWLRLMFVCNLDEMDGVSNHHSS